MLKDLTDVIDEKFSQLALKDKKIWIVRDSRKEKYFWVELYMISKFTF